jgi:hypothetical protein
MVGTPVAVWHGLLLYNFSGPTQMHVTDAITCRPTRGNSNFTQGGGSTTYQTASSHPFSQGFREGISGSWANFRGLLFYTQANSSWMFHSSNGWIFAPDALASATQSIMLDTSVTDNSFVKPSGGRRNSMFISSNFPVLSFQSFPNGTTKVEDFGQPYASRLNVLVDPDKPNSILSSNPNNSADFILTSESSVNRLLGFRFINQGSFHLRSGCRTGLKISSRGSNYDEVLLPPYAHKTADLYQYSIAPIIFHPLADAYRNAAQFSVMPGEYNATASSITQLLSGRNLALASD